MFHNSVLLEEAINGLNINPNGVYVDATYGGGGHSREILNRLSVSGKLLAFDQDIDAHNNLIRDSRLKLIKSNFKYLKNHLNYMKINEIDGLLADFGISSYQIDNENRGFSIRYDFELDMRMNRDQKKDAKHIINNYSKDDLQNMFKTYGEIKNYKKVVSKIISYRKLKRINTTNDLIKILEPFSKFNEKNTFFAKVFQAIRIEVNNEIEVIKDLLETSSLTLKSGGRLVCISYHSLEDRLVKRFIQFGNFNQEETSDFYGNKKNTFRKVGKIVTPSEFELKRNNRSRSAKLRIAEKVWEIFYHLSI